jgi:hypothetical protein
VRFSHGTPVRLGRYGALLALCTGIAVLLPGAAPARELSATPATLDEVFGSAQGGDTITLAAGDYGVFRGAAKPGEVTLRAQPGAAVTMQLRFDGASNITIDGPTLTAIEMAGATRSITVRNADIPGQTTLRTGELRNAGILFDHNVHRDWDKTSGTGEGRIWLPESTDEPSGITIQNSEFRGGLSDGIENGSNGTRILNNVFHDLKPGTPEGVHTDAIALWGSKNTIVRGNYMYRVPAGVMASSGGDHEIIEDNVIDPGEYPYAIVLWSDDGSIVRHNTLPDGRCAFSARCGIISLGSKSSCLFPNNCDDGRGTIIKDNVLGEISFGEGHAELAENSHNLIREAAGGAEDIVGLPSYRGGAHPTTYAGFALAAGSPGTNDASDGLDRAIRGPGPPGGFAGRPANDARATVRVLSTLRSMRRTGKLRLRITTSRAGRVRVSGYLARRSRRLVELLPRSLGRRGPGARTVAMRLPPGARRTLARPRGMRLHAAVAVESAVTKVTLKLTG